MNEAQAQHSPWKKRTPWVVGGTALLLLLLRILPYQTAELDSEKNNFLGFAYSIEDSLQYADFVAQGRDGKILLSNHFSLAKEDPRLIILPMSFIGRMAKVFGLSVAGAWQLAHALLILAFVLVWYWFLGAFFTSPGTRLFAFVFVLLAGGLDGWVVLLGDFWPAAWQPVLKRALWPVLGWTPSMTMYNPLYLAGWLALLPMLRGLMEALNGKRLMGWLVGLSLPLLYLVHAYDAGVLVAIICLLPLHPLLLRLEARQAKTVVLQILPALAGLPAVVILAWWMLGDPLFALAVAQGNSGLFVSPLLWMLGFGGILLAAAYGLRRIGEAGPRAMLLFAWLSTSAAFSFSPFFEGRHFLYFVSLPLGIVAVDGLLWLKKRIPLGRKATVAVLVFGLLVFGNSLVRVAQRGFGVHNHDQRLYAHKAELQMAEFMKTLPKGGVLCSRQTGNWLPHRSGRRVVMGHWFMTPDLAQQAHRFRLLVSPKTSPKTRDKLLLASKARYLFWGPREEALGVRPSPHHVRLLPLKKIGPVFLLEIRPPPAQQIPSAP